MAYAARSERLRLGTGVTPIYSRTPVATAQSFATLDEFSGGRAIIGLGVSHRPVVEAWYGQTIDKPLRGDARVRRASSARSCAARTRRRARSSTRQFHFMGFEPRPDIPIYLAGLSPGMLRLAGEIADGVVLWLCNPEYIRDVVVPTVAEGRAKAGKPAGGLRHRGGGAVRGDRRARPGQGPAALGADPLLLAALLPQDDRAAPGFGDDIAAFDRDGPGRPISDELPRVARRDRQRGGGARPPCAATPTAARPRPAVGGISRTDFDTTLEALAGSLG